MRDDVRPPGSLDKFFVTARDDFPYCDFLCSFTCEFRSFNVPKYPLVLNVLNVPFQDLLLQYLLGFICQF